MTQSLLLYPGPTPDNLACLPGALIQRPQWILWRGVETLNDQTGELKITKIPYDPQTLTKASTTDPSTWGTFAYCATALPVALEGWEQESPEAYRGGGLGYVFTDDDPYTGIDFDHCVDPVTGQVETWAQVHVDALASYTEITPSHTGLHTIVEGTLPPTGRKKGQVEMYAWGRFFTMTGWHLPETPPTIEARQEALSALHLRIFGPTQEPRAQAEQVSITLEDTALLAKARAAKNSAKFIRLWDGDTSMHAGDDSSADMALCCQLAFWTQDPAQLDRLFRQSGLMRKKWDAKRGDVTYGERTIDAALAHQTEHYCVTGDIATGGNGQGPQPAWMAELLAPPKGRPFESFGNLKICVAHSPRASELWYDLVSNLPMVGEAPLEETLINQAAFAIERRVGLPIRNLKLVRSAIVVQCRERPRDPIKEWLEGLPPWDEKKRLLTWMPDYTGAARTAYVQENGAALAGEYGGTGT